MRHLQKLLAGLAASLAIAASAQANPSVYSLDQCADQFVLALSPRADIVGLSMRADDADAYLAGAAHGLPQRRVTAESILAAHPTLVLRYWGGDPRLVGALQRRGITVVTLAEATDFDTVRRNVRVAAAAMDQPVRGEVLVARMDRQLAAGQGAWSGRSGLYLTSGGYTSGPGTLIDSMLRAAGMTNQVRAPGFAAVSLESLVIRPPGALVQGFFDHMTGARQHWGPGRHQILRDLTARRSVAVLPATILACPAWFAADGVTQLAAAARR